MEYMMWLRNFMGGYNLPEIISKDVTITPEIAELLMEHNSKNPRRVSKHIVKQYADDMRSGNWHLNGEAIVIDREGNMKNGQHRCLACIESGCAFETILTYGVEPGQNLYDMQYRRRLAQEMGVPKDWEYVAAVIVTDAYRSKVVPKGMTERYIREHGEELNRACVCCRSCSGNRAPRARKRDFMAATYLMLRCGADKDKMNDFISVVNSGFPIDGVECSTAIVLAKYMDGIKSCDRSKPIIMQRIETFVRAYTDFRSGVRRRVAYRVNSTENAEKMLAMIRAEDGLE